MAEHRRVTALIDYSVFVLVLHWYLSVHTTWKFLMILL
jgi:hypothetical protein